MSDDEWGEPSEPEEPDQLDDQVPPAEFTEAPQSAPVEGTTEDAPEESPQLMFPNVEVFVREHLSIIYSRDVGPGTQYRWAAEWWRYAEAISRLESIWRAWEHLRLDAATGMSVWWRDHADPHMRVLMAADGPFRKDKTESHEGNPLPCTEAPEGLF